MSLRFLKYGSLFLSIAIIMTSLIFAGPWVFIAPLYVFGLIPLLELVLPHSQVNMSKVEEEVAKKDMKYDLIVWSVVPFQFALMFYFLNRIGDGTLAWWEIAGMIFSFGIEIGRA